MSFWDNTRSGGQSSGGGGGMYRQGARPAGTFSGAFQRQPMTASGPGAVARMGGVQRPSPASNRPMNGPGYATNIGQVQPQPRTAPQMPVQGIPRPAMQVTPAPAPAPTPAPRAVQSRPVVNPSPAPAPPPPKSGGDDGVPTNALPTGGPPVYDGAQQGLGGMTDNPMFHTQPYVGGQGGIQAPPGPVAIGGRPGRQGQPGEQPPLYDPPQEEIQSAAQQFGKAR